MFVDYALDVEHAVKQLVPDGDSSFVDAVMGIRVGPYTTMDDMPWQKKLAKLWLADRAPSFFPLIRNRQDILHMIVTHGCNRMDACSTMLELDHILASVIGQDNVYGNARSHLGQWYLDRFVVTREKDGEDYAIDIMAMAQVHEMLCICNQYHLPPNVVKSMLELMMK